MDLSPVQQSHLDTYAQHGAVRVERVFDEAWLEAFSDAVLRLVESARAGRLVQPEVPDPAYGRMHVEDHDGYVRAINLLPCAPEIRRLLLESAAPEVLAAVIGSTTLRLWVDGIFMKSGNAPETATPWHNDECTYSFVGEHRPSLWIALTDVDADNSPLITLSGSHRDPWRYHSPFSRQDVPPPPEFRPWQHLVDRVNAPDAPILTWPARRGDVIVLHPKTIHGSLPRRSSQPGMRLAYSVRWLGDDVRWMPNALNLAALFDTHPAMQRGAPPPEELFPVVWRALP
jgi:ectoine hydroxylase-related dioxygenase (phytanoyl-CoA dioxygenase family)